MFPCFRTGRSARDEAPEGVLTLEMNRNRNASLTGYARTLAAAGLTMTLTQLDSVDAVQIRTPLRRAARKSFHALDAGFILLQDTSWLYPERTVQLYFAGANGKLQAEKRAISYESPEDLLENTLQALIAGQSDQLQSPVPAGTEASGRACDGNAVRLCCPKNFPPAIPGARRPRLRCAAWSRRSAR